MGFRNSYKTCRNYNTFDLAKKAFTVSCMTTENSRFIARIEAVAPTGFSGASPAFRAFWSKSPESNIIFLSAGDASVMARGDRQILCEVVGFRDGKALLLPFAPLEGVGLGCKVEIAEAQPTISPSEAWLGRVVNALGEPIDGKGPFLSVSIRSLSAARRRPRIPEKSRRETRSRCARA